MENEKYWNEMQKLSLKDYFQSRRDLTMRERLAPKDYVVYGGSYQINTQQQKNHGPIVDTLSIFSEDRRERLETALFEPNREGILESIINNNGKIILGITAGFYIPLIRSIILPDKKIVEVLSEEDFRGHFL